MVRIDMSEYMEKYSVSRLIGAPPGYVGYEEGGQLTEAVRRKPYSVVLFDEIEKAHPDVFNVLLQVLDDGRITDSQGRTVDFKNTILIMTSNIGSDDGRITDSQGRTVDFKNTILIMTSNIGSTYLLDGIEENGEIKQEARELVDRDLRGHFRPEFLNRLDEIIMFKPLTKDNIGGIVELLLDDLNRRLKDQELSLALTKAAKDYIIEGGYDPVYIVELLLDDLNRRLKDQELSLALTKAAKDYIIEGGYDPVYGARPLKRYIQKYVETLTAKLILSGDIRANDRIVIDVENGELTAHTETVQEVL